MSVEDRGSRRELEFELFATNKTIVQYSHYLSTTSHITSITRLPDALRHLSCITPLTMHLHCDFPYASFITKSTITL